MVPRCDYRQQRAPLQSWSPNACVHQGLSWSEAYQQHLRTLADKRSRTGQRLRAAWQEAELKRQERTLQVVGAVRSPTRRPGSHAGPAVRAPVTERLQRKLGLTPSGRPHAHPHLSRSSLKARLRCPVRRRCQWPVCQPRVWLQVRAPAFKPRVETARTKLGARCLASPRLQPQGKAPQGQHSSARPCQQPVAAKSAPQRPKATIVWE